MQCIEVVIRQRGRFGPSASTCIRAALSRLPSVDFLNTAPLSTATSDPREKLDMVDAEAFFLCFYEECSAMMKVLRNVQRQTVRTHTSPVEETGSVSTPRCTERDHGGAIEYLNDSSYKGDSCQSCTNNLN